MENPNLPTLQQIQDYLTEYGWNFRLTKNSATDEDVIIAPYSLNTAQGILVSFSIKGEFVLVSSVGLFTNVSKELAFEFLELNDTIKLAKLFATPQVDPNFLDIDISFELWAESWEKGPFFAFMDMMAFGIEKTLEVITQKGVPHETNYVEFTPAPETPTAPTE